MADNYLEKKQEALRNGGTVYRRTTPSLEQLLRRTQDSTPSQPDYKVLSAQLDAMCRAAAIVCPEAEFVAGEGAPATIEVKNCSQTARALLALQLKAAELGLKSQINNTSSLIVFK